VKLHEAQSAKVLAGLKKGILIKLDLEKNN
jgi:hypothetical protein